MKNFIRESQNFLISLVAIVLILYSFLFALDSGLAYQLAWITDKVKIYLGLMPEHMLSKMIGGYSTSIVPVNVTIFIILNIVIGYVAFKVIRYRGTKYSGLVYGLFMVSIFSILASVLIINSQDPFNWLALMVGIPIALFIQACIATCLLYKG